MLPFYNLFHFAPLKTLKVRLKKFSVFRFRIFNCEKWNGLENGLVYIICRLKSFLWLC